MNREDIKQTILLAMSEHHSGNVAEAQRIVDAILSAIEAAGVRLVPAKPTHDQMTHAMLHRSVAERPPHIYDTAGVYRVMLAASPYAPAQKDETND